MEFRRRQHPNHIAIARWKRTEIGPGLRTQRRSILTICLPPRLEIPVQENRPTRRYSRGRLFAPSLSALFPIALFPIALPPADLFAPSRTIQTGDGSMFRIDFPYRTSPSSLLPGIGPRYPARGLMLSGACMSGRRVPRCDAGILPVIGGPYRDWC